MGKQSNIGPLHGPGYPERKRKSGNSDFYRAALYVGGAVALFAAGYSGLALALGAVAALAVGTNFLLRQRNPSIVFALIILAGFLAVFWLLGGMAAGGLTL